MNHARLLDYLFGFLALTLAGFSGRAMATDHQIIGTLLFILAMILMLVAVATESGIMAFNAKMQSLAIKLQNLKGSG